MTNNMTSKYETQEQVLQNIAFQIERERVKTFKPVNFGGCREEILQCIRIAYDMEDTDFLKLMFDCDVPPYELDCEVTGASFKEFHLHFEASGRTEEVIEEVLFRGNVRYLDESENVFDDWILNSWDRYMDRLASLYEGPELFKFRLESMGFKRSTNALKTPWDLSLREEVRDRLRK